jgi:hypothetical protein
MNEPESPSAPSAAERIAPPEPLRCDFCGDPVMRVRRVALDGEYERLRTRHLTRYACESCSEQKERARIGLERG